MHIIGCLDSPTKGEYHLNGENVANMQDDQLAKIRNKEIGFVFQKFPRIEIELTLKEMFY